MKMIVAIIKPFKLDDVRDALQDLGIEGMTITEVKGYGRQKGQVEADKDSDFNVTFLPKLKLEVAIPADLEDRAVDAIQNAARTDRIGDGKIFVYDLNRAVRIRSGETGPAAL